MSLGLLAAMAHMLQALGCSDTHTLENPRSHESKPNATSAELSMSPRPSLLFRDSIHISLVPVTIQKVLNLVSPPK